MRDVEKMKAKDLVDLLNKYSDDAIVMLSITVSWCDNYGGGTALFEVVDGKRRDTIMEVEE